MWDHEIKAYAARVAYASELKRKDFTEDEMMLIENAYHCGEAVDDTAYLILNHRAMDNPVVETEE